MAALETVTPPLAQALERGRERFNARFAQMQAMHPSLDGEQLGHHLRTVIAPIADAVHRVRGDRVDAVVGAAYELSLDLLAANLLGATARHPAIADGWRDLAPRIPWLLSADPRAALATVTNALYNLSLHDGAKTEQWIREMADAASQLPDLASMRAFGHVVAWRCGMAEHRQAAIASCRKLGPALATRALGLAESDGNALDDVLAKLESDPWLTPERAVRPVSRTIALVKVIGAFRGFGGQFQNPPTIFTAADGSMVAADREGQWTVIADVHGSALLPLASRPAAGKSPSSFRISRQGEVSCDAGSRLFEGLANASSSAATAHTLAVALDQSHQIFLFGLQ